MNGDMRVYVSELVPELVSPPPDQMKSVRESRARRGGPRTDFGRYFCAGAWERGRSKPQPVPNPGYFILNGEMHVHPKTWAKIVAGLKIRMATEVGVPSGGSDPADGPNE